MNDKTKLYLVDELYGIIYVLDYASGRLFNIWSKVEDNGFTYFNVTLYADHVIDTPQMIFNCGEQHTALDFIYKGNDYVSIDGRCIKRVAVTKQHLILTHESNVPITDYLMFDYLEEGYNTTVTSFDNIIKVFHAESNMSINDLPPAKDILNKLTLITLPLTEEVYLINSIIDEVFVSPFKRDLPLNELMSDILNKRQVYFVETINEVEPVKRRKFIAEMSRNFPTNDPLIAEYSRHLTSLFKEQMKREQFNVNTK